MRKTRPCIFNFVTREKYWEVVFMINPILGIDISKKTFGAALLRSEKFKHKKFRNTPAGFEGLMAWLKWLEVEQLHACMEATSSYGEALAEYLYVAGYQVSVVKPAALKVLLRVS